ncbi:MAG: response regulator, partial [Deltaproteobacteria bacterium]
MVDLNEGMLLVGSTPPPPESPRVFVVREGAIARGILLDLMCSEGYVTEVFDTADALLDAIRALPPDLVIADTARQEITGPELCAELRMIDDSHLVPVVLITRQSDPPDIVVRGLLAGADDCVSDDVGLDELRARVRVQLRNRRDRKLLEWACQQRATFRRASLVDPLTEIANRRAADEALVAAMASGQPLMVMLFDIDHFKKVNDEHGH